MHSDAAIGPRTIGHAERVRGVRGPEPVKVLGMPLGVLLLESLPGACNRFPAHLSLPLFPLPPKPRPTSCHILRIRKVARPLALPQKKPWT